MQNKPNFLDAQMNVSSILTTDYENTSNWTLGQNKPKQTQFAGGYNSIYYKEKVIIKVIKNDIWGAKTAEKNVTGI